MHDTVTDGSSGQAGADDAAGSREAGHAGRRGHRHRAVPAPDRGGGATDVFGAAVMVGAAIWTLVAASGRPARPEGALLAVLAVTAGFAAGRIGGTVLPVLGPAAGALAALALVTAGRAGLTAYGRGAHTALLVLAAGAACCAAWSAEGRRSRTALWLLAALTVAALADGPAAGFALCAAVVLFCLAAGRMWRPLGLLLLGLAAAGSVAVTLALALHALPEGLTAGLTGQLPQGRAGLWHSALETARAHPLRGVGPGGFGDAVSGAPFQWPDAAAQDRPGSALLQLAAEQGVPGAAVLAAAYGWLLWALWRSPRPAPVALGAGAALTGLAVLAVAGDALSHAVVTAGAGLLAGIATARPGPEAPADDR